MLAGADPVERQAALRLLAERGLPAARGGPAPSEGLVAAGGRCSLPWRGAGGGAGLLFSGRNPCRGKRL